MPRLMPIHGDDACLPVWLSQVRFLLESGADVKATDTEVVHCLAAGRPSASKCACSRAVVLVGVVLLLGVRACRVAVPCTMRRSTSTPTSSVSDTCPLLSGSHRGSERGRVCVWLLSVWWLQACWCRRGAWT